MAADRSRKAKNFLKRVKGPQESLESMVEQRDSLESLAEAARIPAETQDVVRTTFEKLARDEELAPGEQFALEAIIKQAQDMQRSQHNVDSIPQVAADTVIVGLNGQVMTLNFQIPPGADNNEVRGTTTLMQDTTLVAMMPHMHVRGKDMTYIAHYADGRSETLLSVPKYDFNWQITYDLAEPKVLPKGTKVEVIAHFDNSVKNLFNPDPTATVRWGDQTWEEMMIGFFTTLVDAPSATRTSTAAQQ